ncbi:MAG: NHL repeat-containing protein [Pseudomonadota bacterium]
MMGILHDMYNELMKTRITTRNRCTRYGYPFSMKWIGSLLLLLILIAAVSSAGAVESLIKFTRILELTGPVDKPLVMPTDIAIGKDERIYIVDSGNHRVLCYSRDGKYLFAFGSAGEGDGELLGPVGITTAEDGSVLLADRGNKRIQIFDEKGQFLNTIETRSGGKSASPVDVAVDKSGKQLYVTASIPFHQVFVYGEDEAGGKVKAVWGKPGSNPGEFRYPATIAIGPDKHIYVVDVFNSRLQVFDVSGKALVTIGSWGITPGHLFRPKGVAIGNDGLIAVSDSYLGVLQLFDSDKRFQGVLGEAGDIAHFTTPTGLAFDGKGRLYVAEMLANRVSVLELEH